jgi:hypothetical protein
LQAARSEPVVKFFSLEPFDAVNVGFPTPGPHAVSDVVGSARDDELGIFLCVRKLKPETSPGFFFVLCLHHEILNIGMPHRNGFWGGCPQSARD